MTRRGGLGRGLVGDTRRRLGTRHCGGPRGPGRPVSPGTSRPTTPSRSSKEAGALERVNRKSGFNVGHSPSAPGGRQHVRGAVSPAASRRTASARSALLPFPPKAGGYQAGPPPAFSWPRAPLPAPSQHWAAHLTAIFRLPELAGFDATSEPERFVNGH